MMPLRHGCGRGRTWREEDRADVVGAILEAADDDGEPFSARVIHYSCNAGGIGVYAVDEVQRAHYLYPPEEGVWDMR